MDLLTPAPQAKMVDLRSGIRQTGRTEAVVEARTVVPPETVVEAVEGPLETEVSQPAAQGPTTADWEDRERVQLFPARAQPTPGAELVPSTEEVLREMVVREAVESENKVVVRRPTVPMAWGAAEEGTSPKEVELEVTASSSCVIRLRRWILRLSLRL